MLLIPCRESVAVSTGVSYREQSGNFMHANHDIVRAAAKLAMWLRTVRRSVVSG